MSQRYSKDFLQLGPLNNQSGVCWSSLSRERTVLRDVPAPEVKAGDAKDYSLVAAAARQHGTRLLMSIISPESITMEELRQADRRHEELKRDHDNQGSLQGIWEMLQQLNLKFDGQTTTLNDHTKMLNGHTKMLNGHTKMLNGHTKTLNAHTEQLKELGRKFDGHTEQLKELDRKFDELGRKFDDHTEQLKELDRKFDGHTEQLKELNGLKNEVKRLRSDEAIFLSTLGKNVADHIRVLNTQTRNV